MTERNDNLRVNGGPQKNKERKMKNENNETRLVSAFNVRWFVAGLLVMVAAWGVSFLGSHLIWSSGGSDVAQAMLSIGLLTVFPLVSAGCSASCDWCAVGVHRMLASVSLGFVVGGILLTGFMLADANRLVAVEAVFVSGQGGENEGS